MLEEQFKNDLVYIINMYSQKGLTIGTQFYIYKDIFNDLARAYESYLKEEQLKQQQQEVKEEEE